MICSREKWKLFLAVFVLLTSVVVNGNASYTNLGIDFSLQNGNFGIPFGGAQGMGFGQAQGFGMGSLYGGYMPATTGGFFPAQGMFAHGIPSGPLQVQYFPWARPTDAFSAAQLGVGAAVHEAPLPPDVRLIYPNGVVQEQTIDSDVRMLDAIGRFIQPSNVFPINIAQPLPRLTVHNHYNMPQYYSFPSYNSYYPQPHNPPVVPPIGPAPVPEPGPVVTPIVIPGGHGGINPSI